MTFCKIFIMHNSNNKSLQTQVQEFATSAEHDAAYFANKIVNILKEAGVKLPSWVKEPVADKQKSLRHPEKLRKNQPKEEAVEEVVEEALAEESAETAEA